MSREYLVQYGRSAFVGRFASAAECDRGDRVLVRGPRGLELGTVLGAAAAPFAHLVGADAGDGDVVRAATADDEADAKRLTDVAASLLAVAQDRAEETGLPLALVDAELTADGATATLHVLPWGECDADPLLAELGDRFGLAARVLDLSRTPVVKDAPDPASKGCGKPGCGTGSGGCGSSGGCGTGGGCSTGSCSRGAVKGADELTAYFAGLRQQIEAQPAARRPLV